MTTKPEQNHSIDKRLDNAELMLLLEELTKQLNKIDEAKGLTADAEIIMLCKAMGVFPNPGDESELIWRVRYHRNALLYSIAELCPALSLTLAFRAISNNFGNSNDCAIWLPDFHIDEQAAVLLPCCPKAFQLAICNYNGQTGSLLLQKAKVIEKVKVANCNQSWLVSLDGWNKLKTNEVYQMPWSELLRDFMAIQIGILARAWRLSMKHAKERKMFKRTLADFDDIQLRFCQTAAHLESMMWFLHAKNLPDFSSFQRNVAALCDELQQFCGGTGFMFEHRVAGCFYWLHQIDSWCRRPMFDHATVSDSSHSSIYKPQFFNNNTFLRLASNYGAAIDRELV